MMLFIGMISGGIKPLFYNIKGIKVKKSNILCSIIVVILLFMLSTLDFGTRTGNIEKSPLTVILLLFLDTLSTVVLGVCVTALLMIIGYYDTIITYLGDIFNIKINKLFISTP